MQFGDLMAELEGVLPEMALRFLPMSLSRESQQKLCELEPEDAGKILNHVIDLINCGSIETVESLTQKALKCSLSEQPYARRRKGN